VNAIAPGLGAAARRAGRRGTGGEARATTPLVALAVPRTSRRRCCTCISADYVTGETIIVDGGRHISRLTLR